MAGIQIIETPEVIAESRVAIIAGRYNQDIVERLVIGCMETLLQKGLHEESISLVRVPGAFELPLLAKVLAKRNDIDAIIALGAVIKGDTAHFEYVSGECARGLSSVALECEKPIVFGVLTVDDEQQAWARAGEGTDNKGVEAANTALEMISIMHRVNDDR
ncbi:MAG: 6,7-dimethyl-8-ribityllumazine synthase [Gammaproteobacteria bacterium]